MISAIFFMNPKGDVLISRVYRDDVNRTVATQFRDYIQDTKEVRSPIKIIGSTTFFHLRLDGLYIVAVSRQNVNAALVFEVLHQLVQVFESYMKHIDEESIYNNFVLIYELLDEILDFGYPQMLQKEALNQMITQGKSAKQSDKAAPARPTILVTGAVSWRSADVRYRRNQIYIDVIESVNMMVSSATRNVLSADVTGKIVLRCELSGMPECTIGMNDKAYMLAQEARRGSSKKRGSSGIAIEDVSFHQCVRLGKFDADRTISFIPPDGEFELMKYRTTEQINKPFNVIVHKMNETGSRLEAHVTVKSNFPRDITASKVKIMLPVPKNTAVARVSVATGKAKYIPESDCILWKIRRFPGRIEATITAEVELSHVVSQGPKVAWSRPPISMEFQVPMFTASGLQIRFLKVIEKSHYQAVKWVRYVTKNGSYQVRI
eukprot:m51a1_g1541 Adaptor protein complex 2 (AP-2), mu subunit (434) ;mRNA; r:548311-550383